jgi:dipicolinate synthase subunit B
VTEYKKKVGLCVTGSFCTLSRFLGRIEELAGLFDLTPVFSEAAQTTDTRFGAAADVTRRIEAIAGKPGLRSIAEAERVGPEGLFDLLLIAPCTGNTLAKLALGITDGAVTMAAKSHLRGGKPLVIALSTNDALGANAKNLGELLNVKNVYFAPMYQDDCVNKAKSLTFRMELLTETLELALEGRQIQPMFG